MLFHFILYCRDANRLVVEPVERMTSITEELSDSLFGSSGNSDELKGLEIKQLELVIRTMARFFSGVSHRKTTLLYGPDGSAWSVDVCSEAPGEGVEGMGTRVSRTALETGGLKTKARDVLKDPIVVGYLQGFAASVRSSLSCIYMYTATQPGLFLTKATQLLPTHFSFNPPSIIAIF